MRAHLVLIPVAFTICPFITRAQTIANAGPDQDICLDTTTMQANTPLPTETGMWSLTSGNVTITDPSDPTTSVTGIYFGQNVLTWTIITPEDTTSDQVSITRYEVDPPIPNAGPDQIIVAPPLSATMGASPPIFPQVCTWSVVQGTGLFSNENDPYATVIDLSEGINIFRWTSDSGPCSQLISDDVVITVQLSTIQTIANAGPDQATCFDTTSMQANTPLPTETGLWVLTSGTATITDASDPTTTVTGIDFGENVLTWTIITPEDTTSDQVSVTRYYVDPFIPNAGSDQTIYAPPFSALMDATPPIFPQVCTWSVIQGTGTFSNLNAPQASVTDLSEGVNVFRWTSDSGPCFDLISDDVMITVLLSTSIRVDADHRPVAMWFDQASGLLTIVGDVQANSLSIVNALGQAVAMHTTPSAGSLDLSGLPPGSYAATATISGERRTLRFVVGR